MSVDGVVHIPDDLLETIITVLYSDEAASVAGDEVEDVKQAILVS